eukprot:gene15947-21640_t
MYKLMNELPSNSIGLCSEGIINNFTDTVTSQGIIGIFEKPTYSIEDQYQIFRKAINYHSNNNNNSNRVRISNPLIVILDNLADPGNIGTIIRTCYGFGVNIVIHCRGCDIWSPKCIRSSMGLVLKMPIIETNSWDENMNLLLNSDNNSDNNSLHYQILLADAHDEDEMNIDNNNNNNDNNFKRNVPYYNMDYQKPTVIVIGSEASGISKEVFDINGVRRIHIPMMRNLESFNAAIAASIIIAEANKQRSINI